MVMEKIGGDNGGPSHQIYDSGGGDGMVAAAVLVAAV